jgi:hypothetical protein
MNAELGRVYDAVAQYARQVMSASADHYSHDEKELISMSNLKMKSVASMTTLVVFSGSSLTSVRRSLAVASGVVALSLGALVAATAAQAQASTDSAATINAIDPSAATAIPEPQPDALSQCPAHSLCMWKDAGYMGTFWYRLFGTVRADVFHYVGDDMNDMASSFFNNRAWAVGLGKNWPANFGNKDPIVCYLGDTHINNFQNFVWPDGSTMNDSISSYELASNPNFCTLENGND